MLFHQYLEFFIHGLAVLSSVGYRPLKYFSVGKLSAFLRSRGCNGEQLSQQFCIRMTAQVDPLLEHDQFFFVAVVE